jgi:hypothetical protein
LDICCGIEIKASTAYMVVLRGTKTSFEVVDVKLKKLELTDPADQSAVYSFRETIISFFAEMNVTNAGIKARNTKGEFSGGPISFKIEGIIQTTEAKVQLYHSAKLAATIKKHPVDINELKINKYQQEAFKVAYHMLADEVK